MIQDSVYLDEVDRRQRAEANVRRLEAALVERGEYEPTGYSLTEVGYAIWSDDGERLYRRVERT